MIDNDEEEPEAIELTIEAQALLDNYKIAKEAAELWEAKRKELAGELIYVLGPAKRGTVNGQPVVTKIDGGERMRFDPVRFRNTMPDVYNDFLVPMHVAPSIRLAKSS